MDLSVISFLTSEKVASQVMKILFDSLSRDTHDGSGGVCSSFCAYTADIDVQKIVIKDDVPTETRYRMKKGNNTSPFEHV